MKTRIIGRVRSAIYSASSSFFTCSRRRINKLANARDCDASSPPTGTPSPDGHRSGEEILFFHSAPYARFWHLVLRLWSLVCIWHSWGVVQVRVFRKHPRCAGGSIDGGGEVLHDRFLLRAIPACAFL